MSKRDECCSSAELLPTIDTGTLGASHTDTLGFSFCPYLLIGFLSHRRLSGKKTFIKKYSISYHEKYSIYHVMYNLSD
jgi:hypothetical protein